MATLSNPTEIARETLRQLAMRRVAPTPDNYKRLYHEIAGTQAGEDAFPEQFVRQLVRRLPRDTAERQRLGRNLDQAMAAGDPRAGNEALERYLSSLQGAETLPWNDLIATLVRQWEARQAGWTTARKREALDRVLNASDPAALFPRLQGLVKSWTQAPADGDLPLAIDAGMEPLSAQAASGSTAAPPSSLRTVIGARLSAAPAAGELVDSLRMLLSLAFEDVIPAFLGSHPDLADEAVRLAVAVKQASDADALSALKRPLRRYAERLENAAADDAEIRTGLLDLLRLLLRNIDELVIDDSWLSGQIEMLREIVDAPPTPRTLDAAEQQLKGLIYKQGRLKQDLIEAQRYLREMLAGFVDQLAHFAESTGSYHDRIGGFAQRIAETRDINAIGPLLGEVMHETRAIQEQARQSRDELTAAREHARSAELRITQLQQELDEASRLMRHDQLTGALNRRGLEEMGQKERARADRRRAPLSVALLDIDNFKRLNDNYGHQSGDEALVMLASTVRRYLRPQDTLARQGGEEFVILFPDTDIDQANLALVRLQRELTREFFMANNDKVVITFSAGVTPWTSGEAMQGALSRADAAMYQAKQAGRNRVFAVPAPA
ncbi:GGDEF domain-containing protein [Thauera sinica]|uniref:diguanylate cyclase n=1 Tax=Thauera sinica TaxID=2665146 RepID=A0ABW1AVT0_9RHOO|nr:GGDEF domain-containing protein [Thauera sp. K11]